MEHETNGRHPRFDPCNGEQIRSLRKSRRWTQQELATRSGYSLRLIQKAESGGSLKPDTLNVLAEALSTKDEVVTLDHLMATPLIIVQQFIEGINKHEANAVSEIRHLLAEDIEVWCAGEEAQMPFAGSHHGIEEFDRFFKMFFSMLTPDPPLHRNMEFAVSGDQVVAWGQAFASVKGMPETPAVWIWHRYIVRDGKIVSFHDHFDTQVGTQHLAEARARGLLKH